MKVNRRFCYVLKLSLGTFHSVNFYGKNETVDKKKRPRCPVKTKKLTKRNAPAATKLMFDFRIQLKESVVYYTGPMILREGKGVWL